MTSAGANNAPAAIIMEDVTIRNRHDIFRHHRRLIEWATLQDGYLHPDVRIAHSLDKGFHMVVAPGKRVRSETRIVSCPIVVTISVLNAYDIGPFSSHGTKFPQSFLQSHRTRPEMIQAFFLMEQYIKDEDSWWAPYIKTLPSPQDVNDLQFESANDLAWLKGTNLKAGFDTQSSKWQDMYSMGVRSLKMLGWSNALNNKYTWELYRWAATMFGSRSFTSGVLDDTLPADQARMGGRNGVPKGPTWLKDLFIEKFSVLLPMLDILNHWPITRVEWQARSTYVGMQVLDTYESGQELSNNYGPKDNEGLLLSYGFVIPENRFDHVVIDIKPQPGSPIDVVRTWQRDVRSHAEFKKFLFHPDHPLAVQAPCLEASPFSYDLLDTISILFSNDRELQTMVAMEQSLMSASLGHEKMADDCRNLLMTLSQLHRECRAQGTRLYATSPDDLEPQSPKQLAAQIYRNAQSFLYEVACMICEFVLLRAATDWSQEILEDKLKERVKRSAGSVLAFTSLQKTLHSQKCVTRPSELLSEQVMLEMLPQRAGDKWRIIWPKLLDNMKEYREASFELAIAHSNFALLLSIAYTEYVRGTKLPPRTTIWLDQLSQSYPPSDGNWSYVPHSGPWAPGEEPPPGLVALLAASKGLSEIREVAPYIKPEMVCWGWNVVEEEKVLLSTELVQMIDAESPLVGEVALRLYCKQY